MAKEPGGESVSCGWCQAPIPVGAKKCPKCGFDFSRIKQDKEKAKKRKAASAPPAPGEIARKAAMTARTQYVVKEARNPSHSKLVQRTVTLLLLALLAYGVMNLTVYFSESFMPRYGGLALSLACPFFLIGIAFFCGLRFSSSVWFQWYALWLPILTGLLFLGPFGLFVDLDARPEELPPPRPTIPDGIPTEFLTVAAAPDHIWRSVGIEAPPMPANPVEYSMDGGVDLDEMLVPVEFAGEIELIDRGAVGALGPPLQTRSVIFKDEYVPTKELEREQSKQGYFVEDETYSLHPVIAQFTFEEEDLHKRLVCTARRTASYRQVGIHPPSDEKQDDRRRVTFIPVTKEDIGQWSQFHEQFKKWAGYHRHHILQAVFERYKHVVLALSVLYIVFGCYMAGRFYLGLRGLTARDLKTATWRQHPTCRRFRMQYRTYCISTLVVAVLICFVFPFTQLEHYWLDRFLEPHPTDSSSSPP